MSEKSFNFIEEQVNEDNKTGKYGGRVHTRFPPEPNGYMHIGHAKAFNISYSLAKEYGGTFNLRFDDTNPVKEDEEYVESIMEDMRWLGCNWDEGPLFASDYFEEMYEKAVLLINKGKAYVDDLSAEDIREYRGTLTEPGRESPFRNRPVEESLDLFRRMREGEFENGARVLRAKIDMASPNINMRDPVIYRISHARHHRQGDAWCLYPMYDYAHPIEDAIEGITHSLCSLEFEDHRPLYDWVLRECEYENPPIQIEFARLNLTNTIMSKRYLRRLVEENYVDGWDDPRMPTVAGMRRRGYTPVAIRAFLAEIGVAKANSVVDTALLEHFVREDLGAKAPRAMAILEPLKVTITNWEAGKVEMLPVEYHPDHPEMGGRDIPFTGTLYIEKSDFMEDAPKKFFRLAPGREVRLKSAYIIKCEEVVKDEGGEVVELKCSLDHESRSGLPGAARKVKGTLHWVDASDAKKATVRLYDTMLKSEDAEDDEKKDFVALFNHESIIVLTDCLVESALSCARPGDAYQFMRQGYYILDRDTEKEGRPVFNRIVPLKDSWAKMNKK